MLNLIKRSFEAILRYGESYNEYRLEQIKKVGNYSWWY